jgi:hypothetical protein
MKTIRAAFALPILAMALASVPALAQDHQDQDHRDNHTYKQHQEWKTGSKIQQDDWNRRSIIGRTIFAVRRRDMSGARLMGITCWRTTTE